MGDTATFTYNERDFFFRDRAIAYVENGKVSIRTRALGTDNPTIQLPESGKNLASLFTDYAVKVPGSAAQLRQRTAPANNDPKLAWFTGYLQYSLDPVDDLVPGTYMINVEFADRGRGTAAADYKTPSVAVATFQVKQATVEKPIADNCTSCHWNTNAVGAPGEKLAGAGFVLDPVRHNKPFNAQAIDQCGGCHDYASGETAAAPTWTTGGGTKPISKRVHSIHNGANLKYPVITVDHEDSVLGRQWQITYPQDVRNCQSCHSTAGTSGTWATNANRIACMGCHDKDAATAHMKLQVYDPTPIVPWSGDEQEACVTCH
jgi:predicted CXXCH cytochrome family protein